MYKDGEVLSIVYDVWIGGIKLELDRKQCIQSVDVKETVEGADMATIQVADPEFLYIEDNIFVVDNTVKIKLGWSNTTYRVEFNGYISAIDIDFASDGIPIMTLTCMDNTHKMNREKKNNTYNKMTSADVVKKIVQSYGFKCIVDSSYSFTVQETITQSKQTDIDFITSLANKEVYPFTARLVGDTFYYVKMGKLETSVMTLHYREYPHEVISFTPQINKELRQTDIKNGSTDTGSKTTSESDKEGESKYGNTDNTESKLGTEKQTPSSQGKVTYNPKTNTWSKNGDSFFSKVGKAIASGVSSAISTAGSALSILSSLQSATKTTTSKVVKPVVTSTTRTGGGTGKGVVSYLKA